MNTRLTVYSILLCSFFSVSAQTLNKEITVEHDIIPEVQEANRLYFQPTIKLAPVKAKKLDYSRRTVTSRIQATYSLVEPAEDPDSVYVTPYRGYFEIGYFPTYNLGISAGYRIIDTKTAKLDSWLQFDGAAYKRGFSTTNISMPTDLIGTPYEISDNEKYLRHNTVSAGLMLTSNVGSASVLQLGADYTFSRFNFPTIPTLAINGSGMPYGKIALKSQNVQRANINGTLSTGYDEFGLDFNARIGHFAYGKSAEILIPLTEEALRPVRETSFEIGGVVDCDKTKPNKFEFGVNFNFISNSRHSILDEEAKLYTDGGGYSHGLATVTPAYVFGSNEITGSIGARVDISVNSGKAFHIAPAISLGWTPSSIFAFDIKIGGGEHQNTLGSLFDISRYSAPMFAYENSHIPFTIDGALTVGPWQGAYLEVFGGYAIANDWLMPAETGLYNTCFHGIDMKGWHAGAAVGYRYNDLLEIRISAETAPQEYDRGYYLWRDRARDVIGARLKISPISPLDITIGWEFRNRRRIWDYTVIYDETQVSDRERITSLGNMSNVSVGGRYRISDQLSAFITVENLLNRKYDLIGSIPAQGINGLAGISYKF